jgi:hypothetical protein
MGHAPVMSLYCQTVLKTMPVSGWETLQPGSALANLRGGDVAGRCCPAPVRACCKQVAAFLLSAERQKKCCP